MRMWASVPRFWAVGVLYMCTRLIINVTQSFLALYLLEPLRVETTAIATVPLVVYLASLVGTALIPQIGGRSCNGHGTQ